jgi:hypothetical protein
MDKRILKMTGAKYGIMPNEYGIYLFRFTKPGFDGYATLIERPDVPGVLWNADRNAGILPRNGEIEPVTAIDGRTYRALHLMGDGSYELFEDPEQAWKLAAMLNAGSSSSDLKNPARIEYDRQRLLTRKHLTQADAKLERALELRKVKVDDITEAVLAASISGESGMIESKVEYKPVRQGIRNIERIRKSAENAEPIGKGLDLPMLGGRYAVSLSGAMPPGVADNALFERPDYPGLLWAMACDENDPSRLLPERVPLKEGEYSVNYKNKVMRLNVFEISYEIVDMPAKSYAPVQAAQPAAEAKAKPVANTGSFDDEFGNIFDNIGNNNKLETVTLENVGTPENVGSENVGSENKTAETPTAILPTAETPTAETPTAILPTAETPTLKQRIHIFFEKEIDTLFLNKKVSLQKIGVVIGCTDTYISNNMTQENKQKIKEHNAKLKTK